jgi:hypothetical protein
VHERETDAAGAHGPPPPVAVVQRTPLEDHGVVLGREPRTAVADLQPRPGAGTTRGDHQRSARRGDPQGVLGQPVEHLAEPSRVGPHRRRGCAVQDEADVRGRAARRPHRRGVLDERGEVDGRGVEAEVVGRQPRQLHQVGDEPIEPLGLADDHPSGADGVLPDDDTVAERLGEPAHRGQRGTQLVGHRQEEQALALLAARQRVGQLVDRTGDVGHLHRPGHGHPDVAPARPQRPGRGGRPAQRAGEQLPDEQPDRHRDRDPGQQGDRQVAPDEAGADRAGVRCPYEREPADRGGPGLHEVAGAVHGHLRRHRLTVEHPLHPGPVEHRCDDACVARSAGRQQHDPDALARQHFDHPAHPPTPQRAPGVEELRGHDVGLLGEDVLGHRAGGDRHQPHRDESGDRHRDHRDQQARGGDASGERGPHAGVRRGDRRLAHGCSAA